MDRLLTKDPDALDSENRGRKPVSNVLIIEDNDDTAEMIMTSLLIEGYGVRIAKSRDEAVSQMRRNIYHVVLLDYIMDGMPAERFISIARIYSPLSKIILITASARTETVAKNLGINRWIRKPIHIDALKDMIIDLNKQQSDN